MNIFQRSYLIQKCSFIKMWSAKCQPFCLGLNVLTPCSLFYTVSNLRVGNWLQEKISWPLIFCKSSVTILEPFLMENRAPLINPYTFNAVCVFCLGTAPFRPSFPIWYIHTMVIIHVDASVVMDQSHCILTIITTWWGITCRIAITIEGAKKAYLPRNVHFQYRP